MPSTRLLSILAALAEDERLGARRGGLCAVARRVIDLSGASIVLTTPSQVISRFCATDPVARTLVDLEITVGEGPSTDASSSTFMVDEPDVRNPYSVRWPVFTPSASIAGAGAIFAFPMRLGAVRVGALTLYRDAPGPLGDGQIADAYLTASVLCRALLALQAGAAPDALSVELEHEFDFDFSVHQAAGVVAVQASVDVGQALAMIRAHAFASSVSLPTLAARIVARTTSFNHGLGTWSDDRSTPR